MLSWDEFDKEETPGAAPVTPQRAQEKPASPVETAVAAVEAVKKPSPQAKAAPAPSQ